MKKTSLLAVSFALACGASPPLGPIPTVSVGTASSEADLVTADELRAHVSVLASDEYGGRGTLENGEAKAAEYLSAEFARLGLEELPGLSSYQVAARLERMGFEKGNTKATVAIGAQTHELVGGVHFKPFGFSKSGTVDAEVVFAGYGISRPDLGYDDYAELDVRGKVVFVLRHAPKKDKDDKRFDKGRDSFFTTKARVAKKKGAIGMVLVSDPRTLAGKPQGDDLRMSWRLTLPVTAEDRSRARKLLTALKKRFDGAKSPRAKGGLSRTVAGIALRFPEEVRAAGFSPADWSGSGDELFAVQVSGETGERLGAALGSSLADVQNKLDAGESTAARLGFTKRVAIKLEVGKEVAGGKAAATNVVGFLKGADPRLSKEWVVVGAHFDHLGRFDGDGDTVYNGADDNASGTSAMLAVAKRLATGPKPRRSVVFVGFSAEEKGLLGSKSLVRSHLGPERVVFMVNMDMLGRNGEKPVYVGGDGYARGLKEKVEAANADLGLTLEYGGKAISGNSDHAPFYRRRIPVMNLFTGLHDDYHQLSDHPDKLHYGRMAKIAQLATRVTTSVANDNQVPPFIHRPMWLGAAIEIDGKGKDARARITEVEIDAPAGKVGLEVGDVILAIGDRRDFERARISDVFSDVEPGTESSVTVSRGGTVAILKVKRAKRGYLGVFPGGVDEATQKRFGLAEGQGVKLNSVVEKGPAAKAGLLKGDILVEIAGKPVGIRSLGKVLARIGAGEKVPVLVIRNSQRVSLTMVLGERPDN